MSMEMEILGLKKGILYGIEMGSITGLLTRLRILSFTKCIFRGPRCFVGFIITNGKTFCVSGWV